MTKSYYLNLTANNLISLIFYLTLLNPVQAEWISGVELPERSKWNGQSDTFNPNLIAEDDLIPENNKLTYVAATSTNPISWKIQQGEGAYLLIYLPPGVEKLNMGINGQALAASQLVMFKDFGEMPCNNITKPASPKLSDFLDDKGQLNVTLPTGWLALGDSRTAAHERNQEFINTSSCLFFGFFNANNLNQNGVQLQTVSFTYNISDNRLSVYKGWAAGNKKLTVNSSPNGKVTITNNQNTDSKVCPGDCTPTDYPADTEVTLTAEVTTDGYMFNAWDGDCKDKTENPITIKMDNDKTCSAIFKPIPVTLEIKNENDGLNGGLIASYMANIYNNNYILCGSLISNFDNKVCTAHYDKQTDDNQIVEILIAVPKHGFILESWGNNTTTKESFIIFDGKNPQTYSPKFIPIN